MSEPQKFQYRTVVISQFGKIDLGWYGDNGWELVAVMPSIKMGDCSPPGLKYIFKRPVSEDPRWGPQFFNHHKNDGSVLESLKVWW